MFIASDNLRFFYGIRRGNKLVYSRIILLCCLCTFFLQIANAEQQCPYWVWGVDSESPEEACSSFAAKQTSSSQTHKFINKGSGSYVASNSYDCNIVSVPIGQTKEYKYPYRVTGSQLTKPCDCPPKDTIYSGAGLRKNGELFNPPAEICIGKCLYDFSDAVAAQEVRSDGHITTLFYGDAKSLAAQCGIDDTDDEPPPLNPCGSVDENGDPKTKDYCEAPPEGCPSGYITGMFNGKKICVKQDQNDKDNCKATTSDPYKCLPNKPNDPTDPNEDGSCGQGTVKVLVGNQYQCKTQEVPPNPDSSCPSGYVKQTYDGVSLCVPDNQIPDANDNCPLNTSLQTLSDGSKVCRSGNDDGGGAASEPTGSGGGDCDPTKDWLCKDFDLPDTEKLTINDVDLPEIDENKISWSQQCPPDETVTLLGKTYSFSYATTCSFLSTYIYPLFVAFGYFSGAMIIIGAVRK